MLIIVVFRTKMMIINKKDQIDRIVKKMCITNIFRNAIFVAKMSNCKSLYSSNLLRLNRKKIKFVEFNYKPSNFLRPTKPEVKFSTPTKILHSHQERHTLHHPSKPNHKGLYILGLTVYRVSIIFIK